MGSKFLLALLFLTDILYGIYKKRQIDKLGLFKFLTLIEIFRSNFHFYLLITAFFNYVLSL